MTVTVKAGATRDGTLTGFALDLTADTGGYGNHGPGVMYHAVEEAVTAYRCPHKRVTRAPSTRTRSRRGRSAATGSRRRCSPSSPRSTSSRGCAASTPRSSAAAT